MIETIATVREDFTSNLDDRGLRFYFSWVDASVHENLVKEFSIEQYPTVVALNHSSKKMKYLKHDPEVITESSLATLLNSIIGGNARFNKMQIAKDDLILK